MNILVEMLKKLKALSAADIEAREEIDKVLALPFEQVKQRALDLIADPRRFKTSTENLFGNPLIERLGPPFRIFVRILKAWRKLMESFLSAGGR